MSAHRVPLHRQAAIRVLDHVIRMNAGIDHRVDATAAVDVVVVGGHGQGYRCNCSARQVEHELTAVDGPPGVAMTVKRKLVAHEALQRAHDAIEALPGRWARHLSHVRDPNRSRRRRGSGRGASHKR